MPLSTDRAHNGQSAPAFRLAPPGMMLVDTSSPLTIGAMLCLKARMAHKSGVISIVTPDIIILAPRHYLYALVP